MMIRITRQIGAKAYGVDIDGSVNYQHQFIRRARQVLHWSDFYLAIILAHA
jgi:hypothetical protein